MSHRDVAYLFLLKHYVQLEDLFVSPDARNKGVGKALFAELGKVAQEKVRYHTLFSEDIIHATSIYKDCARLDWSVLKVSNTQQINVPSG